MPVTRRELMEMAVAWAQDAGRLTLAHFQSGVAVERKSDGSPVTRADREAELWLRARIEERFPDDGIVGEEFGVVRSSAPRRWILDPIDGTKSFARGVPLYGVMIAVEEGESATVGAIHFPALGETVWAAVGEGCWWDGRRARVSEVDRMSDAVILTSDVNGMDRIGRGDAWRRVTADCAWTRTWGDCYGHVLVATGRAEAIFDTKLALWDVAPIYPIIEEAGGLFTTLDGVRTHRGTDGVATNAALGAEIRRRFRGDPPR